MRNGLLRKSSTGSQAQVFISNDHTLKSWMKGNFHVQFGIGGDGSDPIADHTKERHYAPLIHVSLEELVPKDHFYRHLERSLDLSFVYEFVKETYAGGGRPSIDPIVFFKLQLVMFFEGLRSERQLDAACGGSPQRSLVFGGAPCHARQYPV